MACMVGHSCLKKKSRQEKPPFNYLYIAERLARNRKRLKSKRL